MSVVDLIKSWMNDEIDNGQTQIDAVCLVIKGTESRLNHELTTVFNQVSIIIYLLLNILDFKTLSRI